ncbi:MAG: hypothetical protein ACW985_12480 [Candidatus Thorarchaeota archaeon]
MDNEGFISYMKKKRKTERTITSCVENAQRFEAFLAATGKTARNSSEIDLDQFIASVLGGKNVARFMWTLQYYFSYIEHEKMLRICSKLVKLKL